MDKRVAKELLRTIGTGTPGNYPVFRRPERQVCPDTMFGKPYAPYKCKRDMGGPCPECRKWMEARSKAATQSVQLGWAKKKKNYPPAPQQVSATYYNWYNVNVRRARRAAKCQ